MKKMLTVVLTLALVFGFGTFALASPEASLEVGIEVGPQVELGIITDYYLGGNGEPLTGLFNKDDMIATDVGLYVSDGNTTKLEAERIFGAAGVDMNQFTLQNTVNKNDVEMLVVAANHDTKLRMESDFEGWDEKVPVMFRFSSKEGMPSDEYDAPVPLTLDIDQYNNAVWNQEVYRNEIISRGNLTMGTLLHIEDNAQGLDSGSWKFDPNGDYYEHIAWVSESVLGEGSEEYLVTEAELEIPFRHCTPALIHLNGAFIMTEGLATGIEMGRMATTIDFIVEAL